MVAAVDVSAPRYRWVILALLTMNVVSGTSLGISLGLLFPAILQDIPMTPVQQGWLSSSLSLITVAFSIPVASWISRFNPWTVRALAGFACGVLILGQAFAVSYFMLFAARAAYGAASLGQQPAGTLLARQWFADHEIAFTRGITIFAVGVVEFGSSALTPYLMEWLGGWRPALAVFGLWALGSTLLWIAFGRERITEGYATRLAAQDRPVIGSVLRYPQLWVICLGNAGGMITWSAFSTFWPGYMHASAAIPLTTLGAVFGLTSLGMAPAGLLFGYLTSRHDIGRLLLFACGAGQVVSFLLFLTTNSVQGLVLAGAIGGASWGYVPIVSTIPFQLPGISPREIAVAASFVSGTFALGGAIGPVLAGLLFELTESMVFSLAVLSFLPATIAAIGFILPKRTAAVMVKSG